MLESIGLHIVVFIKMALKHMWSLFLKYELPFAIIVAVVAAIAYKFHWKGLPVVLFIGISFMMLLFGPVLLHKIISDDQYFYYPHLFGLALMFSIKAVATLYWIFRKNF